MADTGHPKEPWLAVSLSAIVPGAGQIYAGQARKGWSLVVCQLALRLLINWQVRSADGSTALVLACGGVWMLLYAITLFDAHRSARRLNSLDFETVRKSSKDPWLAVFLSEIVPGVGHLYLRKWILGVVLILVYVALVVAAHCVALLSYAVAAFYAAVFYWAYTLAPAHRQASTRSILLIVVLAFAAQLAWHFVLDPMRGLKVYRMASESMSPTLQTGDRILVELSPAYMPQRGDIVVSWHQSHSGRVPFVKRAVALPGESVEILDGRLCINGKELNAAPFSRISYGPGFGRIEMPYRVPPDHVFLLGDNGGNSYDSKHYGAVPRSDILGKAYKIVLPLRRNGPLR